jgi:hypothetical protein
LDPLGYFDHVLLVTVLLSGPEETAKPVLPASRDHVCVQVRDALADLVVDREEGAVRFHRLLDRARKQLQHTEVRREQIPREVGDGFDVLPGCNECVAVEDGTVI